MSVIELAALFIGAGVSILGFVALVMSALYLEKINKTLNRIDQRLSRRDNSN